MAYVITDTCTKDELCVDACPVDCIHPKKDDAKFEEVPMLYVNPDDCIDCGACVPVCPTSSIYVLEELPEDKAHFAAMNAAYYN
ncbi:MAG TPA: ferredoxin family protein [Bryobacteraceae bacterium]|nr:ferredoxin family protein [Bryobacteraceae bacterium]